MADLQDKVVLVTGAGAGIGRATALAMAEAGATVAAADIDLAAAQRTAADAATNTRRAIAIEADCGDVASIDAMVARTIAEFGRLDVIVNNAGVTRYAPIMDLTEADWDRIHRVNAKGVFFCLQRAAKEMIRQGGGRIVNIASISGRGYAGASNAAYAASKGAVIALDQDRGAAARPPQHQRQRDLPGRDPHRIGRPQRRHARRRARHYRGRIAGRTGEGHPDRPRQHPGGHRRDGGVPRLARRPQHYRPSL